MKQIFLQDFQQKFTNVHMRLYDQFFFPQIVWLQTIHDILIRNEVIHRII